MPSNLDGVLTKPSLLKHQLGIIVCGLRENYTPTFFDFNTLALAYKAAAMLEQDYIQLGYQA